MDTNTLVDTAQKGGQQLLNQLDQSGFSVTSAFWWLNSDNEQWWLVVASPEVTDGPLLTAYAKVDAALQTVTPKPPFGLNDVYLVPPDEPLVKALRSAFRVGAGSLAHISNTTLNNVFVESAYLYRS